MAKKPEATLFLRIKTLGQKLLKSIPGTFKKIGVAAGALAAGIAIVGKGILSLALRGSELKEVENSFKKLALSQGQDANKILDNMRKLSKGTVSNLELMKQANNALLLGLPVDRFGDMLNIARTASKATGESMEFMLKSIVVGLGRGSKLILDNLGIIINTNKAYETFAKRLGTTAAKLTEAEKKQAFINEALRIGRENADKLGSSTLSLRDRWAQLKTQSVNLSDQLGAELGPAVSDILGMFSKMIGTLENNKQAFDNIRGAVKGFTKVAFIFKNVFVAIGDTIGGVLGTVFGSLLQAAEGNFKAAFRTITDGFKDVGTDVAKQIEITEGELEQIDKAFAQRKKKRQGQEIAELKALQAKKREVEQVSAELKMEDFLIQEENKLEQKAFFQELEREQDLLHEIQTLNQNIEQQKDASKKLQLVRLKNKKLKDFQDTVDRKRLTNFQKFDQFINSQKVSDARSTFSSIATLQSSNSKTLFRIGQAAAVAGAIVNTASGVTLALKTFPGPLGIVMGSLVGLAGAVQIAKITSTKFQPMADGGIVPATAGGTPAILGEGGFPEAVIPLDDAGGGGIGTTVNLTVVGGMLGNEDEARAFAMAIDTELLKLRQNNESVAFDEGIV